MFPPLTNFTSDKYSLINFSIYTYLASLAEQVKLAEETLRKPFKYLFLGSFPLARKLLNQLLIVLDS